MSLVQNIIFGLVTGSYIAIAAIGFTLIYGLMNFINFAYGEYLTIGAFIGYIIASQLAIPIPLVILLTLPVAAVAGWIISRIFFTPIRDTGPIPLLLTSIGLGYILRNGIRIVAGAQRRFFEFQQSNIYRFDVLGGFYVNDQHLFVIGIALATFASIHLLLTRTDTGIAMRAMGVNENLAQITGIQTEAIRTRVWLLTSMLAGLAGVMLGVQRAASPFLGFDQLLVILAAAILGGAGSAYGAIAGAYILGLTISLTIGILPTWASDLGTTMAFAMLILVLLIKPEGIAGAEVRRA